MHSASSSPASDKIFSPLAGSERCGLKIAYTPLSGALIPGGLKSLFSMSLKALVRR
jgi:hypothetical protein